MSGLQYLNNYLRSCHGTLVHLGIKICLCEYTRTTDVACLNIYLPVIYALLVTMGIKVCTFWSVGASTKLIHQILCFYRFLRTINSQLYIFLYVCCVRTTFFMKRFGNFFLLKVFTFCFISVESWKIRE